MNARERFQQLVREFVKPDIVRRGFRVRGETFTKFANGNWGIIQLQRHGLSSAQKLLFTVNIAVASGRLSSSSADQWRKGPPPEYKCDLRMRIGHLLPSTRDKWWTIDSATDVPQLAEEVLGDISSVGFNTLERYMSDEQLRDLWLSGGGWLTELERAQKLLTMVRAIGPRELLPVLESQAASAASPQARAAGPSEIEQALIQSGFRSLGNHTFVPPMTGNERGDRRFTVRVDSPDQNDP